MKIFGFLPLRKGSRSIPDKNLCDFAGKPLYRWALDESIKIVDEVYIFTDYEILPEVPVNYKLRLLNRSKESATDSASSEVGLLEFCNHLTENAIIVFLQATNPFVTADVIRQGLELMGKYDSVLSVVRQKRFVWSKFQDEWLPSYELGNRPRRQDWDGMIVENGSFYISSRNAILKSGVRLSGRIGMVEMCPESYIEIDSKEDLLCAKALFNACS